MDCSGRKNPRELDVSAITDKLSEFKLKEEAAIINVIAKKNLNGEAILIKSKEDLLEMLGSVNDEDKTEFLKMRTDLRRADFEQRKKIDLENIRSKLTWDQVCQLFEQELLPKGKTQRHTWYDYIEAQSINGTVLANPDFNIENLQKELELNSGQTTAFKEMMAKFQRRPQEGSYSSNITNHDSTSAVQNNAMGNSNITYAGGFNAK